MFVALQVGEQLHQVAAQVVRQPVHLQLLGVDLLLPGGAVFLQLRLGAVEVLPGSMEHGHQHVIAAAQRKGRRREEHAVQRLEQLVVRILVLLLLPDNPVAQTFKDPERGQEGDGAYQVENGIRIGDDTGIDGGVP